MKKILYFIGLKILEIGATGVAYYLLCLLAEFLLPDGYLHFWLGGLFLFLYAFLTVMFAFLIGWGLWGIVKSNWKFADKLSRRK